MKPGIAYVRNKEITNVDFERYIKAGPFCFAMSLLMGLYSEEQNMLKVTVAD